MLSLGLTLVDRLRAVTILASLLPLFLTEEADSARDECSDMVLHGALGA